MACELYCCLLPQCEAFRICRSGFPIATIAPTDVNNFSKMKLTKSRCRSQLTDEHLPSQLRVVVTEADLLRRLTLGFNELNFNTSEQKRGKEMTNK